MHGFGRDHFPSTPLESLNAKQPPLHRSLDTPSDTHPVIDDEAGDDQSVARGESGVRMGQNLVLQQAEEADLRPPPGLACIHRWCAGSSSANSHSQWR